MHVVCGDLGRALISHRHKATQQLTSIVDLLQSPAAVVATHNLVGEGRDCSDATEQLIEVGQFNLDSLRLGGHLLPQVVRFLEYWAGEAIHNGGSSQEDGGNRWEVHLE